MNRPAVAFLLALAAAPAAAQPVGAEFLVNTWTSREQTFPSVAADGAGNFVVVWQSFVQNDQFYGIVGRRFSSSGAARGGEFAVNAFGSDDQKFPRVGVAASGDFMVVWESYGQDGSGYGIFARRYASSGAPLGSEFRVNDVTSGAQRFAAVSTDASGGFSVAWQSVGQDGDNYGIFARRYTSVGDALGGEFRVNTTTLFGQSRPALAFDATGRFVVVWQSYAQDGGQLGIFAQRYSSTGTPLGGEVAVNTYTPYDQRFPSVAFDAAGNFLVVWQSNTPDQSSDGVFGQRYASSGDALGGEFRVNTFTTNNQRYPRVVSDDGQEFLVVWQGDDQDGSGRGIFGQRFDDTGAPKGLEFLVNTYTTEQQDRPDLAADGAGGFVVVWATYTPDGSSWGISAQRYCSPLVSTSISVSGSQSVCPTGSAGTATVTDDRGGVTTHQWMWRDVGGMTFTPIAGATGTSYQIQGADFAGGMLGNYELACQTLPQCGSTATSNTVAVSVVSDGTAPAVTPPADSTLTQTLCQ